MGVCYYQIVAKGVADTCVLSKPSLDNRVHEKVRDAEKNPPVFCIKKQIFYLNLV